MTSDGPEISHVELPRVEVIIDEHPNGGAFNMSMDAALLQLATDRELTVVRIYEWSEPTVSLGYFQGAGSDLQSPFPDLPVVRRLSGGGAILHHHEITYSLVLPTSHPSRQNPSSVYELVHNAIVELLSQNGVDCQLRSEFDAANAVRSVMANGGVTEPFLCFLRKNPNDIVHKSGDKIVGSAQRRRKGVTLQHGSVILKASSIAPQVRGVEDLVADFDVTQFRRMMPKTIAAAVGTIVVFRGLTAEERLLASSIGKELFAVGEGKPSDHIG